MSNLATKMILGDNESAGGRLVTADGRTLALRGAVLRADARGGIARVVLEQRFENAFAEPLAVTYQMPLPADGAVSGYAFTVGERRIVGEVDRRQAARERFEEAIASGRTAALVEEERSSLFTQQIGNIPPGATVDRGAHDRSEARVARRGRVGVALSHGGDAALSRRRARARRRARQRRGGRRAAGRARATVARHPRSPRRGAARRVAVACARVGGDGVVALADDGGTRLDRDLVVRWPVAAAAPGASVDVGRPADGKPHAAVAYGLVTLVPPARGLALRAVARDLCLLVDTSGSMAGEPLAQACRVMEALVDTLGDDDTLEMIEFSNAPRRWKRKPARMAAAERQAARAWLRQLRAGGSTEMRAALMEALAPLRAESQRQIVLVSDGAIGFEQEIVADVLAKLPRASRLHTVGVGSAVNRSLTEPAARAGRGVEVVIGLGEDPERAARRICARTAAPLVVELTLEGPALVEHAPARLPDLFAGAPALCAVALRPGGGELVARGRTPDGEWRQRLTIAPIDAGSGTGAVVALFGREKVADLEMRRGAGEAAETIDRAVERLGLDFQIATRLTSWVAVADEPAVDPKAPTRKQRIPQELPFGVSVDGLGLRHAASAGRPMQAQAVAGGAPMRPRGVFMPPPAPAAPMPPRAKAGLFEKKTAAAPEPPAEEGARYGAVRFDDAEVDTVAETAAPAAALHGRVLRLKDGELIVEIDVDQGLDWIVADEARVHDEAGGVLRATVDRARTTASQRIAAGQSLRLVLTLERAPGARPVRVELGGLEILV